MESFLSFCCHGDKSGCFRDALLSMPRAGLLRFADLPKVALSSSSLSWERVCSILMPWMRPNDLRARVPKPQRKPPHARGLRRGATSSVSHPLLLCLL